MAVTWLVTWRQFAFHYVYLKGGAARCCPSFQVEIVAGAELYDFYVEHGERLSFGAEFRAVIQGHEVG